MKVFLDTNVLVSGFATRGLCADVIRLVLAEYELMTAEVILEEFERALAQKIHVPKEVIDDILSFLKPYIVQHERRPIPRVRIRDEDDRLVLASALAAGAEVLVTGDKDLLAVSDSVAEILITSPRGFWERARKPEKK